MFENKLQGSIFSHKGEEEITGWRKLHNVELHNLYSLRNILRIIKSITVRCARLFSTHER